MCVALAFELPVPPIDRSTVIKDSKGILAHWVEHLGELLKWINPL